MAEGYKQKLNMNPKLILLLIPFASFSQVRFDYNVPEGQTKVSAGLYNGDKLVRTVFNNRTTTAGNYTETFDALTDELDSIKSLEGLSVKVISNAVKTEWEGVVGNTSEDKTGDNKHRGFMPFYYLMIDGGKAYYSKYYSEGSPAQNWFYLNDIQRKHRIFPNEPNGVGQATEAIAADNENIYWAGNDPFALKRNVVNKYASYVFATKKSDDSEVLFTNGISYKNAIGRTYKSAIDFDGNDSLAKITGIAVSDKYIFVSRSYKLHILDKAGKLLKVINMACNSLAVDDKGNLWLASITTVKKYRVNNTLSLTTLLTLPKFSKPAAVTFQNNIIAVFDAGTSQQVKAYDATKGNLLWTLGQLGGYDINTNVSFDKFYWSDKRIDKYGVSISFENNGSFWVVDGGNCRAIHFTADRQYIEQVQYLGHNYNIWVDPNNPKRIFKDFLEFEVDYTKPFNDSWKLVNNWGVHVTPDYYNQLLSFRPVTLNNGLTFSFIPKRSAKKYELVQLVNGGGLKFTGLTPCGIFENKYLNGDGNIYDAPRKVLGKSLVTNRWNLLRFSTLGNPVWSSTPEIISSIKAEKLDPAYSGNTSTLRPGEITSGGYLISYNGGGADTGFHLGGQKLGTEGFTWKTSRATFEGYRGDYPDDGAFDIGNAVQYPGTVAIANGPFIFEGYHGEFWKNSQTNKWKIYYENGLMIGQFGITGPEVTGQEAAPEMAGNVSNASVVKVEDTIYLYHNDEGHHSGIHRWKITNINSIITEDVTPVFYTENDSTIELTKNLPINAVLNNGVNGWQRTSDENYTDRLRNYFSVSTSRKSYSRVSPDLFIKFAHNTNQQAEVYKSFGAVNSDNWKLTGSLSYDENNPSANITGGQYFKITDIDGNVIFSMYPKLTAAGIEYIANGVSVYVDKSKTTKSFFDISIELKDGSLLVGFADTYKTIPALGRFNNPEKVKFSFFMTRQFSAQTSAISVRDLIFKK